MLKIWTIYNYPSDYPDKFVVRLWEGELPTAEFSLHDTLEEARAAVPPGLVCLQRFDNDDPVIVETWL